MAEKILSLKERIALLNAKAKAPLAPPPRPGGSSGAAAPPRKLPITVQPNESGGLAANPSASPVADVEAAASTSSLSHSHGSASTDGEPESRPDNESTSLASAVGHGVAEVADSSAPLLMQDTLMGETSVDTGAPCAPDIASAPSTLLAIPRASEQATTVFSLMLSVGPTVALGLRLGKPDLAAPATVLDFDPAGQAGLAGVTRGAELLLLDGRDVVRGWSEAALEAAIAAAQARGDGGGAGTARDAEFTFRMAAVPKIEASER